MLSQPRQLHGMLQSYHPTLRSRSSVFAQRCMPASMHSLILSLWASCHVVLVICHYCLGCSLPRTFLHHLVSMAIQQELHQACEIVASSLSLWITNCLDFDHWIAFYICYFLISSEQVETFFGITRDSKFLNLFKTEGAEYLTIWALFHIGSPCMVSDLNCSIFQWTLGAGLAASLVQVWLQLQDLNLLAGSHGLMCLHDVFQNITIPVSWGPLRFSSISAAFCPTRSHAGRLPCLLCSKLHQWELYYWKVGICANLKKPRRPRDENTLEFRESMRTVSCADSAFHGKKFKSHKISQTRMSDLSIYRSVYIQELFKGEFLSSNYFKYTLQKLDSCFVKTHDLHGRGNTDA